MTVTLKLLPPPTLSPSGPQCLEALEPLGASEHVDSSTQHSALSTQHLLVSPSNPRPSLDPQLLSPLKARRTLKAKPPPLTFMANQLPAPEAISIPCTNSPEHSEASDAQPSAPQPRNRPTLAPMTPIAAPQPLCALPLSPEPVALTPEARRSVTPEPAGFSTPQPLGTVTYVVRRRGAEGLKVVGSLKGGAAGVRVEGVAAEALRVKEFVEGVRNGELPAPASPAALSPNAQQAAACSAGPLPELATPQPSATPAPEAPRSSTSSAKGSRRRNRISGFSLASLGPDTPGMKAQTLTGPIAPEVPATPRGISPEGFGLFQPMITA